MVVHKKLVVAVDGIKKTLIFGRTNSEEEEKEVFKLRYEVYKNKGYINPQDFADELEKDEFDKDKKCEYFGAWLDNRLLGTVRLIKDIPLPTEKAFSFEEPLLIKKILLSKRAEIGRLISIPPDKEKKIFLPRNLVLIFLLDNLVSYGIDNSIDGGYAFIKSGLEKKMSKLLMPFHIIKDFKLIYSKDGIIAKYFYEGDSVKPLFYLTKEFKRYLDRFIKYSLCFRTDRDQIVLRNWVYNLISKIASAL